MKALWKRYAERIDALNLRERIMVFAAAMAVLLALAYTALIEPQTPRERRLTSAIAQKQAEAKSLQTQLRMVAVTRASDPDRAPRERLAELRKQLAEVEQLIGAEERKFTAPQQMRAVIEELLARNRAVRLQSMRNLPTTSIAEARVQTGAKPAAQAGSAERLVYRHGVEIVVAGSYLDLHAYLATLEKLPTQLYWGSLELDAGRYPMHTMKLVVYTLSLDRAWLNV